MNHQLAGKWNTLNFLLLRTTLESLEFPDPEKNKNIDFVISYSIPQFLQCVRKEKNWWSYPYVTRKKKF